MSDRCMECGWFGAHSPAECEERRDAVIAILVQQAPRLAQWIVREQQVNSAEAAETERFWAVTP
jgi:hypothetical protein